MLPTTTASYQGADFQQFYTDAPDVNALMQWLLGSVDGLKVLEPCAGLGAFILNLQGVPAVVDAVDIDERHIDHLEAQKLSWLRTIHADFIERSIDGSLFEPSPLRDDYDALICNPPYGLRFSVAYRQTLKKKFPNLYARESYGLFMHFAIRALRPSGRYVFIVPDTFLTSRNHSSLREFLLTQAAPTHIVRFKSKRFESVDFGYGNLCIIAGNHKPLREGDEVLWVDAVGEEALAPSLFTQDKAVPGSFFKANVSDGWVHPTKLEAIALRYPSTTLGAVAECRTGIYTGDNIRFCAYDAERPPVRSANGHRLKWSDQVRNAPLSEGERKHGITGPRCYVPFIRGGHRLPFEATSWALNWSVDAVRHYANDKKARLQNSRFYFQPGLAIPMVTSGRISASLMDSSVFDQGVVGVFPENPEWLEYLLIYINSDFVSKAVKLALSPGANNSANYIKKIPVPLPTSAQLAEAKRIVGIAREVGWNQTAKAREAFVDALMKGDSATNEDSSSDPRDVTLDRSRSLATNLLENR